MKIQNRMIVGSMTCLAYLFSTAQPASAYLVFGTVVDERPQDSTAGDYKQLPDGKWMLPYDNEEQYTVLRFSLPDPNPSPAPSPSPGLSPSPVIPETARFQGVIQVCDYAQKNCLPIVKNQKLTEHEIQRNNLALASTARWAFTADIIVSIAAVVTFGKVISANLKPARMLGEIIGSKTVNTVEDIEKLAEKFKVANPERAEEVEAFLAKFKSEEGIFKKLFGPIKKWLATSSGNQAVNSAIGGKAAATVTSTSALAAIGAYSAILNGFESFTDTWRDSNDFKNVKNKVTQARIARDYLNANLFSSEPFSTTSNETVDFVVEVLQVVLPSIYTINGAKPAINIDDDGNGNSNHNGNGGTDNSGTNGGDSQGPFHPLQRDHSQGH